MIMVFLAAGQFNPNSHMLENIRNHQNSRLTTVDTHNQMMERKKLP
jgi:hypothetical protein